MKTRQGGGTGKNSQPVAAARFRYDRMARPKGTCGTGAESAAPTGAHRLKAARSLPGRKMPRPQNWWRPGCEPAMGHAACSAILTRRSKSLESMGLLQRGWKPDGAKWDWQGWAARSKERPPLKEESWTEAAFSHVRETKGASSAQMLSRFQRGLRLDCAESTTWPFLKTRLPRCCCSSATSKARQGGEITLQTLTPSA